MNNNQLENVPVEISQGLGISQSNKFSSQKTENSKISNLSFEMENDTLLKSEIAMVLNEFASCKHLFYLKIVIFQTH